MASFLLLSAGEAISSPSLMAIAARLHRSRRALYWLAGMAGNVGSSLYGLQWTTLSHRHYSLIAAGVAVAVGALALWRSDSGRWR